MKWRRLKPPVVYRSCDGKWVIAVVTRSTDRSFLGRPMDGYPRDTLGTTLYFVDHPGTGRYYREMQFPSPRAAMQSIDEQPEPAKRARRKDALGRLDDLAREARRYGITVREGDCVKQARERARRKP